MLKDGLPQFSKNNESILYLPPVRSKMNQSYLNSQDDKQIELMKTLNKKLRSRSKIMPYKKLIGNMELS